MIKDQTIDQAIIECVRTLRALKLLRAERKIMRDLPYRFLHPKSHAAVKRASMDLTRKLADLRQGR